MGFVVGGYKGELFQNTPITQKNGFLLYNKK